MGRQIVPSPGQGLCGTIADMKMNPPRIARWAWLTVLLASVWVLATEIDGVQMASMDQPRVMVMVRRTPTGEPLAGKGDAAMAKLLGIDDGAADKVTSFAAYLDTGASGIVISAATADALGITRLQTTGAPGKRVIFHDVGVGGSDRFNTSEPLYISLGSYQALGGTVAEGAFRPAGGPWSCQVGPLSGGALMESLVGPVDVVGMPVMAGKIVVIDPKPVNRMEDVMRVRIIDGGGKEANAREGEKVPATNRHVKLSYADFAPFTYTEPHDARRPAVTSNPFIGTDPVGESALKTPGIVLRHGARRSEGAWLLDTGAVASMISTRQAAALGVRYKAGTQDTGSPVLEGMGVGKGKQFTLSVGGIGGMKKVAGFLVEELRVPTAEGDDLVYRNAPVLVNDITVEHPVTRQTVTIEGVFGMNLLVASAQITEGLMPDIGKTAEGPFDLIVIDHVKGVLGLQLRGSALP